MKGMADIVEHVETLRELFLHRPFGQAAFNLLLRAGKKRSNVATQHSHRMAFCFFSAKMRCTSQAHMRPLHLFVYGMARAQYFICCARGIRRSFVQACEHRCSICRGR